MKYERFSSTNSEQVTQEEKDAITERIVSRLAERQYKLQRMQEMNKPRHRYTISGAVALAVAACLVALIIFQPFAKVSPLDNAGIHEPTMEEFRGASEDMSEISNMIKKRDYSAALTKTKKSLDHLEYQITEFDDVDIDGDAMDEEMEYENKQDKMMVSELRWIYIYLLTKQGMYKDAKHELKRYIKNKEYASHYTEAQKLLKELKN